MHAPVGILMLDSRFPRPPGDLGHDGTFPFPVVRHVVAKASPERVVRRNDTTLLEPFLEGARRLADEGAVVITTSCGFLTPFQTALCEAVDVPVATSALMQVPLVEATLGARRCAVVTIAGRSLTAQHLTAVGVAPDAVVETTEGGRELTRAILGDEAALDREAARDDVVEAARRAARRPGVGAIVLECTNMTPYAADAARATGLPVFTIVDLVCWLRAGVSPRSW